MTYLEKARDLQQMIGTGKMLEGFEKYYHDKVVVVEADGTTRNGKDEQRKGIQEWMGSVKEMHDGGVTALTSDEDNGITTVESWVDVTFQDGNRMKVEEVGVQKWEGDHIIHERFYYFIPAEMQNAMQQ